MEISTHILNERGNFNGKISRGRQCTYCEKPAKLYVWCEKHLGEMMRIKANLNNEVNKNE